MASRNQLPKDQAVAVAEEEASPSKQMPEQLLVFLDHNTLPKLTVWEETKQRSL